MVKKEKRTGRGQGAKMKNMRKGGKRREQMANLGRGAEIWALCRGRIITADGRQQTDVRLAAPKKG